MNCVNNRRKLTPGFYFMLCHDDVWLFVRSRRRTAARMCSVRMLTVRKQREDTDRVRYKLFCSKNAHTCNLPPTKDALKYHVARANYQACIWHNSLEAAAHTSSPNGNDWDVIDGHMSIHWMDQQPAPKALLQFISCNCLKGHCVGGRCSCRKNVMSCTDARG